MILAIVGKRDRDYLETSFAPKARLATVALSRCPSRVARPTSRHKQAANGASDSHFRHAAEPFLAAARIGLRRQSQPGGEVTAEFESFGIRDQRFDGSRCDRSNDRNCRPWAVGILVTRRFIGWRLKMIWPVAGRGRPRKRHIPDVVGRKKRISGPPPQPSLPYA